MKKSFCFFLVIIGYTTQFISAQIVNIPDPIFKAYLVGTPALNTNADSEIQTSEAAVYTDDIDISNAGITDFTGLQAFVSVQDVYIDGNLHSTLDVSGMTALERLITDDSDSLSSITFGSNPNLNNVNVQYCNFTSIDVSSLSSLYYLHLAGNPITQIDVSNNPALAMLSATGCDLTSLDLSNNLWIQELYLVYNNGITSLDLSAQQYLSFLNVMYCNLNYLNVANGGNSNMGTGDFRCGGNFNLHSVCVDDTMYSNNYWYNWMYVDTFTVFTDTCTPPASTMGIANMNNNSIQIMNNPTTDFAYLSKPCTFQIINISGSIVAKSTYSSVVDMRDLSPGIYFVTIATEMGRDPVSFKVLKQ